MKPDHIALLRFCNDAPSPMELFPNYLAKNKRFFTTLPLLTFPASFPGPVHSADRSYTLVLPHCSVFKSTVIFRDSHTLFLLPEKQILHLNLHSVG